MRRTRSDSVTAAIAAAQAPEVVNPPAHVSLRAGDRPFWDAIISARAASSWNVVDLAHAANLARCQADIERLQGELDGQGNIIENSNGTLVINPLRMLIEKMSARAVSLSRMLHVHAEATCGESAHQAKRAAPEAEAKDAIRSALIPRLSAVR